MLKDQLKKLFGETAIYGISSILTKLISIFLIPLYTSVLDPSDYGTLNLLTSFLSLSLIISIFALDNSAARWFYDTDEVSDKKKTISSWVYFQSFSTLLIGLLLIVGAPLIKDDILSLPSNDIYYIAVASFLLGVLPSITPNWFRMQRRAISTISYTISFSLITIGFTIYFVLFMNLGVKGIFMATLISNGIMSIVSLFIMKGWYNFKDVNLNRIKELLTYALPLLPTILAMWILNSSASFFIDFFHDKNELGLFQIGLSIASGMSLIVAAFRMAFPPFAYSIYKEKYAKPLFSIVLSLYSFIMCGFALIFALFSEELLKIFTQPAYYVAALTTSILFFNRIMYGYTFIVGLGNGIVKDNKPLAKAVLLGTTITVILFICVIPVYGKLGAALAMFSGYLVIPIYVYVSAQKRWFIPFKPLISILFFLFATLMLSSYYLFFDEQELKILIRIGMLIVYLLACIVTIRFLDQKSYLEALKKLKELKVKTQRRT